MKEFWKSVCVWQIYDQKSSVLFFEMQCRNIHLLHVCFVPVDSATTAKRSDIPRRSNKVCTSSSSDGTHTLVAIFLCVDFVLYAC